MRVRIASIALCISLSAAAPLSADDGRIRDDMADVDIYNREGERIANNRPRASADIRVVAVRYTRDRLRVTTRLRGMVKPSRFYANIVFVRLGRDAGDVMLYQDTSGEADYTIYREGDAEGDPDCPVAARVLDDGFVVSVPGRCVPGGTQIGVNVSLQQSWKDADGEWSSDFAQDRAPADASYGKVQRLQAGEGGTLL